MYIRLVKLNMFIVGAYHLLMTVLFYIVPLDPSLIWVVSSAVNHARRGVIVVSLLIINMIWILLAGASLCGFCRQGGLSSLLITATGVVRIFPGIFSLKGDLAPFIWPPLLSCYQIIRVRSGRYCFLKSKLRIIACLGPYVGCGMDQDLVKVFLGSLLGVVQTLEMGEKFFELLELGKNIF